MTESGNRDRVASCVIMPAAVARVTRIAGPALVSLKLAPARAGPSGLA
jgi:hypothetical protein